MLPSGSYGQHPSTALLWYRYHFPTIMPERAIYENSIYDYAAGLQGLALALLGAALTQTKITRVA